MHNWAAVQRAVEAVLPSEWRVEIYSCPRMDKKPIEAQAFCSTIPCNIHGHGIPRSKLEPPLLFFSLYRLYSRCRFQDSLISPFRQMRAFGAAGVIVSPHGSALVNLLWATRHAGVIELFPVAAYPLPPLCSRLLPTALCPMPQHLPTD